ncbi:FkbM family methyltransferase [Nodosilinea nodulosa]|uniref:FkbM family methyltransferase n=1 Tax=Nodosilinea nodulosa TaxID=416001 RepID=UPI000375831E|nr:FkbM family methyltransferase [Nodosilinea nodulosa]
MASKSKISVLAEKIAWKGRQKYSQFRCRMGGGKFVWKVDEKVQFVSYVGDPFSHVLFVCKGHEKVELNWCDRWLKLDQSAQSVIDCGANIGYFSAMLAQRCFLDKVLAIEGNRHTAKLCQATFDILNLQNSQVIEAILAENSEEHYHISDKPGLEPWQNAVRVTPEASNIHTTTLDQVILDSGVNPSLVKIDCEGSETLILKGANYTLESLRPAFMIECNDTALETAGTNRKELFGLLRKNHYKLFHLASFTGFYPFGLEVQDNFPSSEFNFAAIPNDHANVARWTNSANADS